MEKFDVESVVTSLKRCKNVGSLIKELEKFPKTMRVGFGDGVEIKIYGFGKLYLRIEEI